MFIFDHCSMHLCVFTFEKYRYLSVKTFEINIWQFLEDFVFKLENIHRNENNL